MRKLHNSNASNLHEAHAYEFNYYVSPISLLNQVLWIILPPVKGRPLISPADEEIVAPFLLVFRDWWDFPPKSVAMLVDGGSMFKLK